MKGVMMLINLYPPFGGGTERQAERLAAYLVRQKVFAGVITRRLDNSPQLETRDGVTIIRIREIGPGKFKSLSFIVGAVFNMVIHANSFDVLHAHLAFAPAVAASITGRLLGKRVIVKFGNSGNFGDVHELNRSWRGRLALAIIRRWADAFIALTGEIEFEMLKAKLPPSRVIRMVNGVDTELFCPPIDKEAAKASIDMAGKTLLLFTGRLTAQKALPNLLQALKQVSGVLSNVHLILVGDGEESKPLEMMAADLDINPFLTFFGRCDSVQIYLNAADVFVLPSLSEGLSNSLLEAMATGLPCVATRVGGSIDALAQGECGLLISPNNNQELVNAILYLVRDPKEMKRMGQLARQRAIDHFDLEVVGSKYLRLYNELVHGTHE
jgi:L-malate glycosyltransferase